MPMVQNVDLIYLAGIGVFHLLHPHTWSVFLVLSTISTQIPVTCPYISCILSPTVRKFAPWTGQVVLSFLHRPQKVSYTQAFIILKLLPQCILYIYKALSLSKTFKLLWATVVDLWHWTRLLYSSRPWDAGSAVIYIHPWTMLWTLALVCTNI